MGSAVGAHRKVYIARQKPLGPRSWRYTHRHRRHWRRIHQAVAETGGRQLINGGPDGLGQARVVAL